MWLIVFFSRFSAFFCYQSSVLINQRRAAGTGCAFRMAEYNEYTVRKGSELSWRNRLGKYLCAQVGEKNICIEGEKDLN